VKLDLSIGQRLAIGLALLLFILVAVLVGVSRSHEGSARAQAAFTQQIAPLRDQAFTLERAVYEVGIAARAYLLNPDAGTVDEYQRVVASARDALRALHDVRKTKIGDALYSELAPLVYLYLVQADRLVHDRRGATGPRTERALAHLRERAVEAIRVFSDYQADQARAALSGMAVARQAVTRDLTLASVLALLFFILLAVLTAESIRRPTQELLRVAQGFEKGHWKSALAWAPQRLRSSGASTGCRRTRRSRLPQARVSIRRRSAGPSCSRSLSTSAPAAPCCPRGAH
jgi:CHASE3 domain sensor protein